MIIRVTKYLTVLTQVANMKIRAVQSGLLEDDDNDDTDDGNNIDDNDDNDDIDGLCNSFDRLFLKDNRHILLSI